MNAHNLYLETLAESGLVGLTLLALLPLGLGVGIVSLRRRRVSAAVAREASVALGACVGIFAHAAFDWDWQLPALMIPTIVLAFGVMAATDPGPRPRASVISLFAVPFVALALLLAGGVLAARDVERGKSAAANGQLARALSLAEKGIRRDPGASEPRRLEANVLADLAGKRRAIARSRRRSPDRPATSSSTQTGRLFCCCAAMSEAPGCCSGEACSSTHRISERGSWPGSPARAADNVVNRPARV